MKSLRHFVFFLLLTAAASASITVQSPTASSTVPNPVRVIASDPNAVHMKIYVDHDEVYGQNTQKIDTAISLSPGLHQIVVQSWTSAGEVDKYSLSVTATDTGFNNVASNLEELMWQNCGSCGNHIGDTRYVTGSQTLVSSPALRNRSSRFAVAGNNHYTNYYWYLKSYDNRTIKRLRIEFDLFVPRQFATTPQAIEFEAQHRWNNRLYNMALQMGYKNGYWRTFDYGRSAWVSTGIPFKPLTPDTWHHIVADFEIDYATGKRRLVAVGLDGTRKVPTQNSTLPALNSPGMNYTTFAAFQLDMNSSATDYHVFVDNYRFHWE